MIIDIPFSVDLHLVGVKLLSQYAVCVLWTLHEVTTSGVIISDEAHLDERAKGTSESA